MVFNGLMWMVAKICITLSHTHIHLSRLSWWFNDSLLFHLRSDYTSDNMVLSPMSIKHVTTPGWHCHKWHCTGDTPVIVTNNSHIMHNTPLVTGSAMGNGVRMLSHAKVAKVLLSTLNLKPMSLVWEKI